MTNTPEWPKTATNQPAPSALTPFCEHQNAEAPASVICSINCSEAFVENDRNPHVPVSAVFGGGSLHSCRLRGSWDLDQVVLDHANKLFRSIRRLPSKIAKGQTKDWDDLTFRMGPQSFIYADAGRIVAFASAAGEAEQLATEFGNKYHKPKPKTAGGRFYLIQLNLDGISTKDVTLTPETVLTPEALRLRYGRGCEEWHHGYVKKLQGKASGLTIFEGKPGTGKTYYLRHLMGELKESHRFYFIPAAYMGILSKPDFIGFWADQRSHYSDKQLVVILEDSDGALMARGNDNREQVSALLNLADGMLGDFLRLQIICTINCSASDIDQALLRPGRLICHRVFGRLDYSEAAQLAESLGRKLPQTRDYSLAEVFAGDVAGESNRPRIGFAL